MFVVDLPPLAAPRLTDFEEGRLQGFWEGCAATQPFLEQERANADRYYAAACRGSFTVPMRSQGKTHAERELIRGGGSR